MCRPSSTIALKDFSGFFTKLGRNNPYMALSNNCSNGYGSLHIQANRLKIDEKF